MLNTKKLTSKKLLLLLIYSPGMSDEINEPIKGRTRIVKMMFLFDQEIKKKFLKDSDIEEIEMPEFYAWDYGPFSKQVYDDIEFFINNGFIENKILKGEIDEAEEDEFLNWAEEFMFDNEKDLLLASYQEEEFKLTNQGLGFVDRTKLYADLTENQKSILKAFKASINKASLHAILRYVYLKYPEYTSKSKIKGRIIG